MIYEYMDMVMEMTDDNLGYRVVGLRLHHLQSQELRPLLGAQPAALLEGQEEIIMSTVIVVLFVTNNIQLMCQELHTFIHT